MKFWYFSSWKQLNKKLSILEFIASRSVKKELSLKKSNYVIGLELAMILVAQADYL